MKLIIAGSRDITDYKILLEAIRYYKVKPTEIVCGKARGVDTLGEEFGKRNNIPIKYFPADWSLGNSAGHIRNRQMGDYADALLAIWDGKSRGTKGMIDYAKSKGLKVFVYIAF